MKDFVAILQNIRSLHNVGSIFRTADAAGISKIYLCGITPAPINKLGNAEPKLAKASLGAEKYIPWEKHSSTLRLINKLKKEGYKIYSIEQDKKSVDYRKIKPGQTEKVAVVMGNEVKGLPKPILSASDKILEIPMHGKKESLNVSVAFGIVAFEFRRN
jgi:tRNA G18 (ribose-2'-O)-methylase SpoU